MLQRTITLYRESFGGLPREIWALSAVMLINRSGTMVIPFLTIYLTQSLNFSLVEAGYVMSAFGVGSLIGTYLGGRFTDKFGQYPVQLVSLFLTGVSFLVMMYLKTFWSISIGILITSIIADAMRPANMSAIAVYSKPELHTRSVALNRFAINLGFSIGPAVGGFIMAHLGADWLFIVDGITCITAAFIFYLIIPRKEENNQDDRTVEKKVSANEGSVYRDYRFILFVAFQLLVFLAFFQMFNSIPVFFKENLGLNEDQIGALLAMNGVLIVIMEMPLIYKLEKVANKIRLIYLGTLIITVGFFLLLLGESWIGVSLIFIILITIGEMINFPFGNSYALQQSNPENRGRYMAFYGMSFSVAIIISPLIGMYIAENLGFNALWIFLGSVSLISALGLWWLNGSKSSPGAKAAGQ